MKEAMRQKLLSADDLEASYGLQNRQYPKKPKKKEQDFVGMRPRCHKKVQCIAVIKVSCICALVKLNALQPSAFLKPQLGIHFGVS